MRAVQSGRKCAGLPRAAVGHLEVRREAVLLVRHGAQVPIGDLQQVALLAIESDLRILNPHLAEYRVPRFSDVPEIEVVLIDRKDQPSMGAGETPLTGIAPAVANAMFSAVGIRLRSLPLVPQGLPTRAA